MNIVPKNWRDFQHYKDRNPPWIRLHKSLLDNYDFQCLPVASRALAPMLWLLASDSLDGKIDATPKRLAFRLRMTEREVIDALKPLIDNGFFMQDQGASEMLAGCLRDAVPETEAEALQRTEAERTANASPTLSPPPKSKQAITLKTYLGQCRESGSKPVPDGHSIREWAKVAGITDEMLQIAWVKFKEKYTQAEKSANKRYKDWPGHFATAVKDNWFGIWFSGEAGLQWSSKGMTFRSVLDNQNKGEQ